MKTVGMAKKATKGLAPQGLARDGRRILNANIKRDYMRLLEMVASPHEPDYEEVEQLANKYRMYFDEHGDLIELTTEGGR